VPTTIDTQEQEKELRRAEYEAKEQSWQGAKQAWKQANPEDTIHRHKDMYIMGMIDKLPWEDFVAEEPPMPLDQWNKMIAEAEKVAEQELESKKKTSAYIMREKDQQVKKETQAE
jgi:hypothetical protein